MSAHVFSALAGRILGSPLGPLRLRASEAGIRSISFSGSEGAPGGSPTALGHLDRMEDELASYFAGVLQVFSVPLDLQGTAFQVQVWTALQRIPYGVRCSYQDVARAIGNPNAVRAVGLANGSNPVAIVVPCHRVIGSSGKLVGYGGELWRKEWLLTHEGNARTPSLFPATRALPR